MSLALWTRWLAWLAVETTALVAGAALLHLWLRSPRASRTLWRAALTAVALVWMVELTGLRERMRRQEPRQHHFVVKTELLAPAAPASSPSPEWLRPPAADLKDSVETTVPLWIWLGGSMLLLARFCLARVWLAQRRRAAGPADAESLGLIARWHKSFGLRRVQSQVWDGLRGPVAFGVFRPTIALPPDFIARFSFAEREAMLAHEMAHLAAHDPFWWMISDAIVALAWWHPLVWWARRQLQSAHEAAADEASALLPGGARILAECLVRLGRDLTAPEPARALGVGGNGPRSQLAVRIERLLRGPRAWQSLSVWAQWMPQVSAIFVAVASVLLPIQTGLSGSILALLIPVASAHAEVPQSPPPKVTRLASVGRLDLQDRRTNPPPEVSLLVRFVSLPEHVSDGLGVDWVFGLEPTNNPAVEISRDWGFGVEPMDMSSHQTNHGWTPRPKSSLVHPENLLIDHLRTDGQCAILKPEQFAALLNRIEKPGEADFLIAPQTLVGSGLQAHVASQDLMTCVTGVQATNGSAGNGAGVNYSTDNIALGIAVDVFPKLVENGQWRLQVRASHTSFIGYDNPGKNKTSFSVPGGKLIEYETPHPHFRALEADAEETVLPGQTLALRGPLWTETTRTKAHFLSPAKTTTIRQRLYIFVTPTVPSPSEIKKN